MEEETSRQWLKMGQAYQKECKEDGYTAIRATLYVFNDPKHSKPQWYVEEMRCFEDGRGKVLSKGDIEKAKREFKDLYIKNLKENIQGERENETNF